MYSQNGASVLCADVKYSDTHVARKRIFDAYRLQLLWEYK